MKIVDKATLNFKLEMYRQMLNNLANVKDLSDIMDEYDISYMCSENIMQLREKIDDLERRLK